MKQHVEPQNKEQQAVYVGIDIGGTGNKIAILSQSTLDIQSSQKIQVNIKNKPYILYTYSVSSYPTFWNYLQSLKKTLKGTVKLVGTGGVISKVTQITELFQLPISQVSEFDAHGAGLQFYKNAQLSLTFQSFTKQPEGEVKIITKSSTLSQCSELLFMSLGSGANFQLYGEGEKGIKRKPAKDPSLTYGDGYFLEGTCLGAGFLMGLGRLSTEQADFSVLLSKMKAQGQLKEYYESVLINLFQMAINMSILHERKYIVMSGGLLSFGIDIKQLMARSLRYIHTKNHLQLTVIRLQMLEGYLGVLGAVQTAIK